MTQVDLSIVTIAWNNLEGVKKTLASIGRQTLFPKEVIVIDGGSQDGTQSWLRDFAALNHPFRFLFISEKDRGIADAFNKGQARASSKWVQFLNSGDVLIDDLTLERIHASLANSTARVICGGIQQVNQGTKVTVFSEKRKSTIDESIRICHPATFCHLDLFKDVGPFNPSFRIAMDTEWFLRVERLLGTSVFEMSATVVADMEPGGISQSHLSRRHRELLAARLLHSKQPTATIITKFLAHSVNSRLRGE